MAEEKRFEGKVKKFLKEQGAWYIKYWGGASYTKSGIPDLLVCVNGFFLGVELKASTGRPSDLQIYHLREIDKAGGYAILLYPEDFPVFQKMVEAFKYLDGATNEELDERAEIIARSYELLKTKWKHFEDKLSKGE